tara:strand:- start:298 stop:462 length:165 start_codon:yes stop_codon:yes gene_type:complete
VYFEFATTAVAQNRGALKSHLHSSLGCGEPRQMNVSETEWVTFASEAAFEAVEP